MSIYGRRTGKSPEVHIQNRVDIIILDLIMPNKDGFEASRSQKLKKA